MTTVAVRIEHGDFGTAEDAAAMQAVRAAARRAPRPAVTSNGGTTIYVSMAALWRVLDAVSVHRRPWWTVTVAVLVPADGRTVRSIESL